MVDDVIRAFMVSQGFCLLMATNQEDGVGKETHNSTVLCAARHNTPLYKYNGFDPVWGFIFVSTIQTFQIWFGVISP